MTLGSPHWGVCIPQWGPPAGEDCTLPSGDSPLRCVHSTMGIVHSRGSAPDVVWSRVQYCTVQYSQRIGRFGRGRCRYLTIVVLPMILGVRPKSLGVLPMSFRVLPMIAGVLPMTLRVQYCIVHVMYTPICGVYPHIGHMPHDASDSGTRRGPSGSPPCLNPELLTAHIAHRSFAVAFLTSIE
jgi:hypothetical protein